MDIENGTFDVSRHGKHFYLLEHDHKVNYEDYLNCSMFHPEGELPYKQVCGARRTY